jgi:hypothetical protein
MNERIRELAFKANNDLDGNVPIGFAEKLAELLLQECADYIDAFNRENMVEEGIGGAELKQHFGVEE